MRESFVMFAGLLDPLVCLELGAAHLVLFFWGMGWFKERRALSGGLACLASFGLTTLIFVLNVTVFYFFNLRLVQEPVLMWYVR